MRQSMATGAYDRIVMNPPFENGQDIAHVEHAYELLSPGGRLVTVMSEGPFFRQDKNAASFRNWLEERYCQLLWMKIFRRRLLGV
jgi:16S rRNA G1207 methylase RsmC